MDKPDYEKIFIFNSRGIGDLVALLPTLHSLRKGLPQAHINLSSSTMQLPLAQTLEGKIVDELTVYETGNRLISALSLIGQIRRYNPDIFVELTNNFSFPLFGVTSADLELHSSYRDISPHLRHFRTKRIPSSKSNNTVDSRLQLLRYFGIPISEINFDFPKSDEELEQAIQRLARYGINGGKTIGLIPESGSTWKDWPVESLGETIDILVHDIGYKVVVFGKYPSNNLKGKPIVDLRGKTTFLQGANLLRYGGLFEMVVGVDTGMMHVAGSVNSDNNGSYDNAKGNLTVSLFAPTDPERFKPYDPTGKFNLVVQPHTGNIKRDFLGSIKDRKSGRYMRLITPKMIVEKIQYHISQGLKAA